MHIPKLLVLAALTACGFSAPDIRQRTKTGPVQNPSRKDVIFSNDWLATDGPDVWAPARTGSPQNVRGQERKAFRRDNPRCTLNNPGPPSSSTSSSTSTSTSGPLTCIDPTKLVDSGYMYVQRELIDGKLKEFCEYAAGQPELDKIERVVKQLYPFAPKGDDSIGQVFKTKQQVELAISPKDDTVEIQYEECMTGLRKVLDCNNLPRIAGGRWEDENNGYTIQPKKVVYRKGENGRFHVHVTLKQTEDDDFIQAKIHVEDGSSESDGPEMQRFYIGGKPGGNDFPWVMSWGSNYTLPAGDSYLPWNFDIGFEKMDGEAFAIWFTIGDLVFDSYNANPKNKRKGVEGTSCKVGDWSDGAYAEDSEIQFDCYLPRGSPLTGGPTSE